MRKLRDLFHLGGSHERDASPTPPASSTIFRRHPARALVAAGTAALAVSAGVVFSQVSPPPQAHGVVLSSETTGVAGMMAADGEWYGTETYSSMGSAIYFCLTPGALPPTKGMAGGAVPNAQAGAVAEWVNEHGGIAGLSSADAAAADYELRKILSQFSSAGSKGVTDPGSPSEPGLEQYIQSHLGPTVVKIAPVGQTPFAGTGKISVTATGASNASQAFNVPISASGPCTVSPASGTTPYTATITVTGTGTCNIKQTQAVGNDGEVTVSPAQATGYQAVAGAQIATSPAMTSASFPVVQLKPKLVSNLVADSTSGGIKIVNAQYSNSSGTLTGNQPLTCSGGIAITDQVTISDQNGTPWPADPATGQPAAMTWTGTVYEIPPTAISGTGPLPTAPTSATPPSNARVVGTVTKILPGGVPTTVGIQTTVCDANAQFVVMWTFNKSAQTASVQQLLAEDSFTTQFNDPNEWADSKATQTYVNTNIIAMQDSTGANENVYDTLTSWGGASQVATSSGWDHFTDTLYQAPYNKALSCTPDNAVQGASQTVTYADYQKAGSPIGNAYPLAKASVPKPDGITLGYQLTVYGSNGQVIVQTACGVASETVNVQPNMKTPGGGGGGATLPTPGPSTSTALNITTQVQSNTQTPSKSTILSDKVVVSGTVTASYNYKVTDQLFHSDMGKLTCSADQAVSGSQQTVPLADGTITMSTVTVDTTAGGEWGYKETLLDSFGNPLSSSQCGAASETALFSNTPQVSTQAQAGTTDLTASASVPIWDDYTVGGIPAGGGKLVDQPFVSLQGQALTCTTAAGNPFTITLTAGSTNGSTPHLTVTLKAGDTIVWQEGVQDNSGNWLVKPACGGQGESTVFTKTTQPVTGHPAVTTQIQPSTTLPSATAVMVDEVTVSGSVTAGDMVFDVLYHSTNGQLTCSVAQAVSGSSRSVPAVVGTSAMSKVTVNTTGGGLWGYQETLKDKNGNTISQSACGLGTETVLISNHPSVTTQAQASNTNITGTTTIPVWDNWLAGGIPAGDTLVDQAFLIKAGQALTCTTTNQIGTPYTVPLTVGSSSGQTPKINVQVSPGDKVVWQEGVKNATGGWDVQPVCGGQGESTVFAAASTPSHPPKPSTPAGTPSYTGTNNVAQWAGILTVLLAAGVGFLLIRRKRSQE